MQTHLSQAVLRDFCEVVYNLELHLLVFVAAWTHLSSLNSLVEGEG